MFKKMNEIERKDFRSSDLILIPGFQSLLNVLSEIYPEYALSSDQNPLDQRFISASIHVL